MSKSTEHNFVFDPKSADEKIQVCWHVNVHLKKVLKLSSVQSQQHMSDIVEDALSKHLREEFPDIYVTLKNVKPNTT